jgi:hypothetical protein
LEIVSTNAVTVLVDGCEIGVTSAQNPKGALGWAIENERVGFSAVVIIEGEGEIGKVVSPDTVASMID